MKICLSIILILVSNLFSFAQIQTVLDKAREITLLESGRDDVRKIFAGYKSDLGDESNDRDDFYMNDAEISITYSDGTCEDWDSKAFNVPRGKAEDINITLKNPVKVNESEIDLSNYKKEKWYHDDADIYAYYDKELGIIFKLDKDEIKEINLTPPFKYNNLRCDQESAKKLSSTKSIFDSKLKERNLAIVDRFANVEKLNLSRTQIVAKSNFSDLGKDRNCSKQAQTIKVSTVAIDPEGDVLTYSYAVSGGKIIGQGAKVIWDLSDAKPGNYTITAAVDDGWGFCGIPKTKQVCIVECPGHH